MYSIIALTSGSNASVKTEAVGGRGVASMMDTVAPPLAPSTSSLLRRFEEGVEREREEEGRG